MPISVTRLVSMFLYRIYVYIKIYTTIVTIIKKNQNLLMDKIFQLFNYGNYQNIIFMYINKKLLKKKKITIYWIIH